MGNGADEQPALDHPITQLLREIAGSGRPATDAEIARIRAHVAAAGFEPAGMTRAGGRLAGLSVHGRTLRSRDWLPNGEAHYLRHVIVRREWPAGTTFEHYVASLRRAILDPSGGIALQRQGPGWDLAFMAPAGADRGPEGAAWILVAYPVEYGYWSTAYQPRRGLDHIRLESGQGERWLRRPRLTTS